MAHDTDLDHAWSLMEKIRICMFTTLDGGDIRSRPMAAHLERDEHAIYFLTDVSDHKDHEVDAEPKVGLAFADASAQKYVSVSGTAHVSNDRAKIRELFSTPAKAWWDSADDPAIRVLKVTPKDAQYWASPGTIVSYVKMLAAAAMGTRPDMGENAKVSM